MVLFRADSISQAVVYRGNMFGIGANGMMNETALLLSQYKWMVLVATIGATPVVRKIGEKLQSKCIQVYEIAKSMAAVVLFALSIIAIVKNTYNPFIYFNF